MVTQLPKCIYCEHSDNPFDREHVMPEAFGTFEPESFVLYNTVCKPCNGHFGRTLELALSRGSMEALLRLRLGIKPPSEAKDLLYRKIELKVGQPGPWFGATVQLEVDSAGIGIEPVLVPQIAFRWKGETEWHYFLERQLDDAGRVSAYKKPQPGTLEIRVLGPTFADRERLVAKLKTLDIKFIQQGVLDQPVTTGESITLEIASQVDATIFRAISKIAFNYVAHQQGADFVLRTDFDDVRKYIRYGTEPPWAPVVMPFHRPILFDDSRRFRQTNGHLITFDWNAAGTGLLVQVSLFNTITYHVVVCPIYSGIWRDDMRSGHHFDIDGRRISPLATASSRFLVPYRRLRFRAVI